MNNKFSVNHSAILILILILGLGQLFAAKHSVKRLPNPNQPIIHPYAHLLNKTNQTPQKLDKRYNNKLLVILVDFQEEVTDDALTTGNGKFQLTTDPNYRASVASPPHDKSYFNANLDALRYYYLAASHGTFNLDYDIYPLNQTAYTLPQSMRYYNPPNANSSLFLARIEEYFKDAFETADSVDAEIDFSQYDHFMIIHAGSDWQHDVRSDTPCDLPSFFIKVGDGKEAIVDNGNVIISYACNVPETISQDFDSYVSDGTTYYTGYGALNGVMAHEFGHSLGLVDLYNTYNFSPMVGQFDIMDSGGSFITEDWLVSGVIVEGMLPCLPGAYSRALMFGDLFKQNGLMVELDQFLDLHNITDVMRIAASSKKQSMTNPIPNIIKIPINEYEYLLVENRSVDPDNDGGTVLRDALGGRVVLYPTPVGDISDPPTYEYDYLLPSFIDADYRAIGGGILVWHVDDRVLYQMGHTDANGEFISNFDYNTVNIRYSHRGVRIIEADGLDDIGNNSSYYWNGTPFEYFHKFRPELGQNGAFISWTQQEWKPNLNANTVPALLDYQSQPSFYGLKDISQPSAIMTFKLSAGCFDTLDKLGTIELMQTPLPIINSNLSAYVLPVLRNNTLHFYFYDPQMGVDEWSEQIPPLNLGINSFSYEPIVSGHSLSGYLSLVLTTEQEIRTIEISNDIPTLTAIAVSPNQTITCSPIYALGKLFVATNTNLYELTTNAAQPLLPIADISGITKLSATTTHLIIQTTNKLIVFDTSSSSIVTTYNFNELIGKYEPITINNLSDFSRAYLVTSDKGNIYKCSNDIVSCIFNNDDSSMITNLAVSNVGSISPVIIFGKKDKVYALKLDGTLLQGFPVRHESIEIEPMSQIRVRAMQDSSNSVVLYFKLISGGYLAINQDGSINRLNSIIDIKNGTNDITQWNSSEEKLYWFFTTNSGMLLSASIRNQSSQPFTWKGYRNQNNGQIYVDFYEPSASTSKVNISVFPSPVKSAWAFLRINNPTGVIKVNIYDISGNNVFKKSYTTESVEYKDIQLNLSGFSSGVYLITVENKKQIVKTKFAVEL
jgi:M6 family metalloprotease-like protein